jgi:hypothetical protein
MAPFIAVLLPTLLLSATVASARTIAPTRQETNQHQELAVAQFMAAVNAYIEWHRVLANPLADLTHGADPEQTMRARRTHRSLIREARALAARPKLFTPCVSEYLRNQIRLAVSGFPPDPDYWPLSAVLGTLPELPVEMNYRFDGSDLVLLDVDADLVVDVLEDALPSSSDDESERDPADTCAPEGLPLLEGSPCDAHQELEMCWS